VSTTSPTSTTEHTGNQLADDRETDRHGLPCKASEPLKNLYSDLDARLMAFGDDIQKTTP